MYDGGGLPGGGLREDSRATAGRGVEFGVGGARVLGLEICGPVFREDIAMLQLITRWIEIEQCCCNVNEFRLKRGKLMMTYRAGWGVR